jgi:hypothetical protein
VLSTFHIVLSLIMLDSVPFGFADGATNLTAIMAVGLAHNEPDSAAMAILVADRQFRAETAGRTPQHGAVACYPVVAARRVPR